MRKKLFKAIAGCAAICFVSGMIVSGNANKAVAAGDIYSDNFDNGFTEDKDAGIYGNGCTLTLVEGMNSNYGGSTESGNCIKVSNRTGYWENAVFACKIGKLEVGKKYTITFDIYHENGETTTSKGEYGTNRACIVHTMPDYTQYGQPNAAPMNEWERISIDFTYDKEQDFVYLEFAYPEATQEHVNNAYEDPNKEEYYIDNFSIRDYVEPTKAPASTVPPVQQTDAPDAVETPAEPAPEYLEPGYEETVGNIDYKVIDNDTVAVIGGEAGKKLNIPDTVTIEERAYKVTSINAKAFQDSDIKNLTIGANVTTIGKSAFANCSSLKKITIKSNSLKVISKKAFKGISKKATVKVPKAKKKAYKKLLKKAGLPTKAKIK